MTTTNQDRREAVARIIDPEAYRVRESYLARHREWVEKTDRFEREDDGSSYPDGMLAHDRIVRSWREFAADTAKTADRVVASALARADAVIALLGADA